MRACGLSVAVVLAIACSRPTYGTRSSPWVLKGGAPAPNFTPCWCACVWVGLTLSTAWHGSWIGSVGPLRFRHIVARTRIPESIEKSKHVDHNFRLERTTRTIPSPVRHILDPHMCDSLESTEESSSSNEVAATRF